MVNYLNNAFDSFPKLLCLFFLFEIKNIRSFANGCEKLNKGISGRCNFNIIRVNNFSIIAIDFKSEVWFFIFFWVFLFLLILRFRKVVALDKEVSRESDRAVFKVINFLIFFSSESVEFFEC